MEVRTQSDSGSGTEEEPSGDWKKYRPSDRSVPVEISPKERFLRYDEELGRGAYKVVYRGYDRDNGCEIAWNVIRIERLQREERERIGQELRMIQTLCHKNLLKFVSVWLNSKREVVLITEMITGGSLKSYLKRVGPQRLKVIVLWCRQILEGLSYLHSQEPSIIHRDIKCDNIFINNYNGEIKIGDLGLSRAMSATKTKSVLGTPAYMAPELYEGQYTIKVDIYAFGMTLLEMISLQTPYKECVNTGQIYKKVSKGEKPEVFNRIDDEQAKELINLCLGPANDRPSAAELLKHPFFSHANEPSSNRRIHLKLNSLPTIPEKNRNSMTGGSSSGFFSSVLGSTNLIRKSTVEDSSRVIRSEESDTGFTSTRLSDSKDDGNENSLGSNSRHSRQIKLHPTCKLVVPMTITLKTDHKKHVEFDYTLNEDTPNTIMEELSNHLTCLSKREKLKIEKQIQGLELKTKLELDCPTLWCDEDIAEMEPAVLQQQKSCDRNFEFKVMERQPSLQTEEGSEGKTFSGSDLYRPYSMEDLTDSAGSSHRLMKNMELDDEEMNLIREHMKEIQKLKDTHSKQLDHLRKRFRRSCKKKMNKIQSPLKSGKGALSHKGKLSVDYLDTNCMAANSSPLKSDRAYKSASENPEKSDTGDTSDNSNSRHNCASHHPILFTACLLHRKSNESLSSAGGYHDTIKSLYSEPGNNDDQYHDNSTNTNTKKVCEATHYLHGNSSSVTRTHSDEETTRSSHMDDHHSISKRSISPFSSGCISPIESSFQHGHHNSHENLPKSSSSHRDESHLGLLLSELQVHRGGTPHRTGHSSSHPNLDPLVTAGKHMTVEMQRNPSSSGSHHGQGASLDLDGGSGGGGRYNLSPHQYHQHHGGGGQQEYGVMVTSGDNLTSSVSCVSSGKKQQSKEVMFVESRLAGKSPVSGDDVGGGNKKKKASVTFQSSGSSSSERCQFCYQEEMAIYNPNHADGSESMALVRFHDKLSPVRDKRETMESSGVTFSSVGMLEKNLAEVRQEPLFLKRGAKGMTVSDVKNLQENLIRIFPSLDVKVTGKFGSKTETAVKKFQETSGLTVNGEVNEELWDLIEMASKEIEKIAKKYENDLIDATEKRKDKEVMRIKQRIESETTRTLLENKILKSLSTPKNNPQT
eukprot:CAMPEP_0114988578 /NCGR_PEP_ID=MMETSP0216-20121206/9683_1 /TAXON_ID=223996 /ORGANISM="Protocruzia adherens, Strain Boccale" /LENGTH=1146 /DNA_ID=CAMNT_0002351387 /DNA_START=250 /DNA_END=3690 /DNA_ORIENTATION=+